MLNTYIDYYKMRLVVPINEQIKFSHSYTDCRVLLCHTRSNGQQAVAVVDKRKEKKGGVEIETLLAMTKGCHCKKHRVGKKERYNCLVVSLLTEFVHCSPSIPLFAIIVVISNRNGIGRYQFSKIRHYQSSNSSDINSMHHSKEEEIPWLVEIKNSLRFIWKK